MTGCERCVHERPSSSQARMERGRTLCETHYYIKDVATQSQEHFVKPSSVNTVTLFDDCIVFIHVLDSGTTFFRLSCRVSMFPCCCLIFPTSLLYPFCFKVTLGILFTVWPLRRVHRIQTLKKPDIHLARLIWMIDKQPGSVNQVMLTLIRTLMWVR